MKIYEYIQGLSMKTTEKQDLINSLQGCVINLTNLSIKEKRLLLNLLEKNGIAKRFADTFYEEYDYWSLVDYNKLDYHSSNCFNKSINGRELLKKLIPYPSNTLRMIVSTSIIVIAVILDIPIWLTFCILLVPFIMPNRKLYHWLYYKDILTMELSLWKQLLIPLEILFNSEFRKEIQRVKEQPNTMSYENA